MYNELSAPSRKANALESERVRNRKRESWLYIILNIETRTRYLNETVSKTS
jgi:hypothetical protein